MPSNGPQTRAWCFTIHNIDWNDPEDRPETWYAAGHVSYMVYQLEVCPDTGRHHWQGYLLWNRKKTLTGCKKIHPTAHWETRRGTHEQARDYCKKDDTRCPATDTEHDPGPFEFGDEPKPGERQDLIEVKAAIDSGLTYRDLWQLHFNAMLRYNRNLREYREVVMPPVTLKPR